MSQFCNYLSPFSWRYGSSQMRSLWSEDAKRRIWRQIWLELARAQSQFGLVSADQLEELAFHVNDIDIERSLQTESVIHHDLMAELTTYASQCPQAAAILHLGATSMDIEDNADALRLRLSLDLICEALGKLLIIFANKIETFSGLPIMAYTHLQPAEPSTLGYRFSVYAQDLLSDWQNLSKIRTNIRGKGFTGAVGTGAAYADLIGCVNMGRFEELLSNALKISFFPVSTQTYSRKQDYEVVAALAGLAASLAKFALDIRFLQTPSIAELSEPFSEKQVGSSAMPFKRNPIHAEKIDSLARQLSVYPQIAWQNAANSILERTLDDSANRRSLLPESFLIADELLQVTNKLVNGVVVHQENIHKNLERYAPFACTERLLMIAVKRGADRQVMHEILREQAMISWQAVQKGEENPLLQNLKRDERLTAFIQTDEFDLVSTIDQYTGLAAERARAMVVNIRQQIISG